MTLSRIFLTALIFSIASACLAVPKILVVQINTDPSNTSPLPLGDTLAQALEEEGRCDPIVWSEADPVFRGAQLDGRVPQTNSPSPNDVQAAQKALNCDYVILTQVQVQGTALAGRIDMYKGVKAIWNDTERMDPGRSSANDVNNALLSVARTWAIRISAGPLKTIKAEPKPPAAPGPSQGQIPKSPSSDPVPHVTDSSQAIADYQKLMADKKVPEATNLLRQAVDNNPLDVALRIQLIQHLTKLGRTREAAEEAQRASLLLPESDQLRAMAAKAYLNSGQSDLAENQLNEALARNPDDPATRQMLADMALNGLKPQAAKDHIDVAMKKAPSKDLAYRRALCDAILGDAAGVQSDLAQAAQLSNWSSSEEETSKFCMAVLGQAMDQSVGDLRSLNQRAAVKSDDPDVAKEIDDQLAIVQARQAFVDGWAAPAAHRKSQGMFSLALKLLSQSLSELKAFLSDGSQDTLTDAGIDLGESIKRLASAREALAAEQENVARHGSTSLYSYH